MADYTPTLTGRKEREAFGGVEDLAVLARRRGGEGHQRRLSRTDRMEREIFYRGAALSELEQIIDAIGGGDLNSVPFKTMMDWSHAWGYDPPEDWAPFNVAADKFAENVRQMHEALAGEGISDEERWLIMEELNELGPGGIAPNNTDVWFEDLSGQPGYPVR